MENKIIKSIKVYLRKKEKQTVIKKQKEQINSIVKTILIDKTPKEAIKMFLEVEELFNSRLDDVLKEGIEAVETITKYKNL
jgi:hypothetical protein